MELLGGRKREPKRRSRAVTGKTRPRETIIYCFALGTHARRTTTPPSGSEKRIISRDYRWKKRKIKLRFNFWFSIVVPVEGDEEGSDEKCIRVVFGRRTTRTVKYCVFVTDAIDIIILLLLSSRFVSRSVRRTVSRENPLSKSLVIFLHTHTHKCTSMCVCVFVFFFFRLIQLPCYAVSGSNNNARS